MYITFMYLVTTCGGFLFQSWSVGISANLSMNILVVCPVSCANCAMMLDPPEPGRKLVIEARASI